MKTTHFFVGPGRSGTSWLFDSMALTGQVWVPSIKEPSFFDLHFERGLTWYDHFYVDFHGPQAPLARVDFSNLYYLSDLAIRRILDYNPQACVVFISRNHRDLFRSMLYFELRKGRSDEEIEQVAAAKYKASDCAMHVARLRELAGDRLVVIDFAWIERRDLSRIYTELGLPGLHLVEGQITNAHMVPRLRWMGRLAKWAALWLRRHEMFGLLQRLKRSKKIRQMFFLEGEAMRLHAPIEAMVKAYFPKS